MLKPAEAETFRRSPLDGVLEKKVVLAVGVTWAPVLPTSPCPFAASVPPSSWRRWAWESVHLSFLDSHRPASQIIQVLKRMCWWETMSSDADDWYLQCQICQQFRSAPVHPPTRSVLADDALVAVLPWQDVFVDVQGPFTRGEDGEQYVLSYFCTRLKVPKLAVLKNLQAGYFSRALVRCVLATRARWRGVIRS